MKATHIATLVYWPWNYDRYCFYSVNKDFIFNKHGNLTMLENNSWGEAIPSKYTFDYKTGNCLSHHPKKTNLACRYNKHKWPHIVKIERILL